MKQSESECSHRVHSAELTNTVKSSGVKPYASLSFTVIDVGMKASGAWNCTWLSMVKLCSTDSLRRFGDRLSFEE